MRQKIIDTNWETLINDYRYTLGNFDKWWTRLLIMLAQILPMSF
jgi:hypothetical protein